MYNQEQKLAFIEECAKTESGKKRCREVFEVFSKYEERWSADLSTRDAKELSAILKDMAGIRGKSQYNYVSFVRKYLRWCGYEGTAKEISIDTTENVTAALVKDPKQFQECLDQMFEPENKQRVDLIYRCYLWLGYMGIQEGDTLSITTDDVDLDRNIVTVGEEEFMIPQQAARVFESCATLTQFKYHHPRNVNEETDRDRVPGKLLLRGYRTSQDESINIFGFRVYVSKATKAHNMDVSLSYFRAWLSGLFYRAYQKELAGEEVSFRDVKFQQYRRQETNRVPPTDKAVRVAKGYADDYNRWKKAYNLT